MYAQKAALQHEMQMLATVAPLASHPRCGSAMDASMGFGLPPSQKQLISQSAVFHRFDLLGNESNFDAIIQVRFYNRLVMFTN